MTKDETSKYTILSPDGKALQFVFPIEAKSVITQPSPGLTMKEPGLYEISGLAWSGYGKIAQVDVSADGGKTWAPAALQQPVLPMALTRFRIPWRWHGGPAVLQSRATDDSGYVQPTRSELIAKRGDRTIYHFNGITSWGVAESGEIKHVYA
jgi:sulfane dehydrogenase subunit SoxC